MAQQNITLQATEYAFEELAKLGYDPQFGARPIKRVIQKEILNSLSRKLISAEIKNGDEILIDSFENSIVFRKEKKN